MKNNSLIFKSPIYIGILLLAIIATAGITLLLVKSPALFSPTQIPTLTQAPTGTSTPTQIPTLTPTLTPTKINLSNIDLSDVLIKSGDLPSPISGGDVDKSIAPVYEELPSADNNFYQPFLRKEEATGNVTVFLFQNDADLHKAYDIAVDNLGDEHLLPISDVGEMATSLYFDINLDDLTSLRFAFLVFVRCNALIQINSLDRELTYEELIAYGKKLDGRLQSVLCQPGYTPKPTKYVSHNQTPTAPPDLGITRAEIQSVFSKPEYGYEFGDVKILRGDSIYKGQPRVMGTRQEIRGVGVIELIGSSDNLVHVLIALPFPHNDKEKYDLNIEQMSLFLELAIPAWSGGSMWLEENFPVAIENGTISTQYNDISIEIKYYKNEEQDDALVKIFKDK